MRTWIQAARPRTLIVALSAVLTGTAVAFCYGYFRPDIFFASLLLGIIIQVATNFANDYFDFKKGADTKERIGPTRVIQAGLITETAMLKAIAITFGLGSVVAMYLTLQGGVIIALLFALAILLGIGYTAGPFPIAYLGLGEIFVLLFWGIIPTGMTAYLHMGEFQITPFLAGIGPGAMATAVLIMNNLRDLESDLVANKKTLIVRFGRAFGKIEFSLMIACAMSMPLILSLYANAPKRLALASLTALFCLPLLSFLRKAATSREFATLFPRAARCCIIYTFFYVWGWLL